MKILFLGTGAADWRRKDHRELPGFRRNAAALIDDCLLIDPGPDVWDALETFGKDPENIRYILNTHRHSDHYCPETVAALKNARFFETVPDEPVTFGRYTVTPLRAHHGTCPNAQHFIITDGTGTLFYGLDSAWLLYDEVAAIQKAGIDFAVLDCTIGNISGDYRIFEHNNIPMVLEMQRTLQPHVKRFCISHMARTLHGGQRELEAQMKPHGIEVAFDGYETKIP